MANIKTQIDILQSALTLKKEALNKIYQLTQQQMLNQMQHQPQHQPNNTTTTEQDRLADTNNYSHKGLAADLTSEDLAQQKQALIDQIESLDNGFQQTFERIRATLNQQKDLYQQEISTLRASIQEIGELDIAIRVLEKKNESLWIRSAQLPRKKTAGRPVPRQVTATYSNMKKINTMQGFDETK